MRKQGFEIIKGGLTVLLAVFILFSVAKAGIFSPPSEPGPTMRPLSDLPTATEIWNSATRTLTSFGTLVTDIVGGVWSKAISSLTDTTTIGGFIIDRLGKVDEPISSRAKSSDILSDATPFKGADISNIFTNTSDIEGILSGTDYVSGVSADASGNILEQLEFIMQNLGGYTYGSSDALHVLTIANGTYDASNLVVSNVKSGVSFGVNSVGTYVGSGNLAYGSDDPAKVLTTAEAAGTFDVSTNLSNAVIKKDITWGAALSSTGTLTPDGGTAIEADLFSGKTAHLTGDWDLDTGTLTLACDINTFNGTDNKVVDDYDGSGDGTNRWCITDSGDAGASDILSGKVAWVDGVAVTGTAYGDSDPVFVLGTATSAGTALVDLFNGTGQGITGGSQANGGVDDYNKGGSAPSNRYSKTWTDCTTGDNCGTGDPNADAKDDSTGLIWSKPCAGSGTTCTPTDEASPTKYTWADAISACANMAGWSLPHQKQFMQAYIDGSYGNLEGGEGPDIKRVYWLATVKSWDTSGVWKGHLSRGTTNTGDKIDIHYVRCVRL
ncbi:DUF1566 domain-containing protein [Patescibacteria group bacterium AH-259-L07]|nr:DUF1566 domain-containing protein [Patescibacteria group bacterium AH-259-L07]